MTLEFHNSFSKHPDIHNFIKVHRLGAEVFYAERQTDERMDGWMDGQTDRYVDR